ncbi:MAG TPA: polysaccharide deacetylase family protein [Panacibacter sp.]|nr:polysaccharide deacetylase family protein [Panacibacter sp.]
MFYTVRAPWIFKKLRPSLVWQKPSDEKVLYLTFDDGPHPTATPFVLDQLKQYNAKATFFCIGKNVVEQPRIYQRILEEGHRVGNHTFNHLNGWKTNDEAYLDNIFEAAKYIDSNLFRPPYGRITKFQQKILSADNAQASNLKNRTSNFTIIMWTLLSGDFDVKLSPQRCLQNVILNSKAGDIIVFHDSTKAWERMNYALPKVLEHFSNKGFRFQLL